MKWVKVGKRLSFSKFGNMLSFSKFALTETEYRKVKHSIQDDYLPFISSNRSYSFSLAGKFSITISIHHLNHRRLEF